MRSKKTTAACAVLAGGLFVGGVAAVAMSGDDGHVRGRAGGGIDTPLGSGGARAHFDTAPFWPDVEGIQGHAQDLLGKAHDAFKAYVHHARQKAEDAPGDVHQIGTSVVVAALDKVAEVKGGAESFVENKTDTLGDAKDEVVGEVAENTAPVVETVQGKAAEVVTTVEQNTPEVGEVLENAPEPGEILGSLTDPTSIIGQSTPDPSGTVTATGPTGTSSFDGDSVDISLTGGSLDVHLGS
jgi:hypothetical protein